MSDAGAKADRESGAYPADPWRRADAYENFMGRWSRLVAQQFILWMSAPSGLNWLDIGCGTGALSEAVINNCRPATLTAIDQSEGFVAEARRRLAEGARCVLGDALFLPVESASVDCAVSGLVINHVPDPARALTEMKRVTVAGGTVAAYIWDYSGTMEFLNSFWNAAVSIDPEAESLHQGRRTQHLNESGLRRLFEDAGLAQIEGGAINIETSFRDFNDYWQPFLGGQGPAPAYLMSLAETTRQRIRDHLYESLSFQDDGSIRMLSRAWAVRASVRH